MASEHAGLAPSPWVRRWTPLVTAGGSVLDVACGAGRHLRWFADNGFRPTGVDRDAAALAGLSGIADIVVADIENGPWPLPGCRFDAVVVTNYLWRPLWPTLIGSVAEGGVLVCETFAVGNESVGRPSNPAFLLRPGELLEACAGLRIVAFEDGFIEAPQRFVQRIAAVRERAGGALPARYPL
jgi:SAM-dependent methyltransferase